MCSPVGTRKICTCTFYSTARTEARVERKSQDDRSSPHARTTVALVWNRRGLDPGRQLAVLVLGSVVLNETFTPGMAKHSRVLTVYTYEVYR